MYCVLNGSFVYHTGGGGAGKLSWLFLSSVSRLLFVNVPFSHNYVVLPYILDIALRL
jgi:hypothetical protein